MVWNIRLDSVPLILIEVDALEVNDYKSLLRVVEELAYGELAVLDIFLLHEA